MTRAAPAYWSRLPNHNPLRFYTAWVIRDRVEPAASPAMSAMTPKAEVNSERSGHATGRCGLMIRLWV